MWRLNRFRFFGFAAPLALACACSAFGQGSLTPPGPPAPTMKTLDEIDAHIDVTAAAKRTAITAAPYTIAKPGSYYLASDLSVSSGSAITIAVSGVDLDLNGHTIACSSGSNTGTPAIAIAMVNSQQAAISSADKSRVTTTQSLVFLQASFSNITIHDGHISSSSYYDANGNFTARGFSDGFVLQATGYNIHVSHVTVNGCASSGISISGNVDNSSTVDHCDVSSIAGTGVAAEVVKNSTATSVKSIGIDAAVAADCYATVIGPDSGTVAIRARTASNCTGQSANGSGFGIDAQEATNCEGVAQNGYGIFAERTAINSSGISNASIGLKTLMASNCIGSSSSGTGLYAVNATNCQGTTQTGLIGLNAEASASYSRGICNGTAPFTTYYGLKAQIAIGCTGTVGTTGSGSAAVQADNKYLMP